MELIPATDPRLWTPAEAVEDIPRQVLPILAEVRDAMKRAPFAVALDGVCIFPRPDPATEGAARA